MLLPLVNNPREKLSRYLRKLELAGSPPPTVREVCRETGYRSTNAAIKLIRRMQADGEVIYDAGCARSLRLAQRTGNIVPLIGNIAAGFADTSDFEEPSHLQIDPTAFGIRNPDDAFALRVRGDSMTGRRFFHGDLVLLDRSASPKHQDVVAALIDQECSLKTLVIQNGKSWLKAENPAYPDLIPAHDLEIQGVAKAVIRILAA